MKLLLICVFGLSFFIGFSQELVSSAGSHSQTNTVQVSWSLGEVTIANTQTQKLYYGEGVHQPIVANSGISIDEEVALPTLSLYPNPTNGNLFIENDEDYIRYEVVDMAGKILIKDDLTKGQDLVNLSPLSTGQYFIRFYTKTNLIRTNKIIKQ